MSNKLIERKLKESKRLLQQNNAGKSRRFQTKSHWAKEIDYYVNVTFALHYIESMIIFTGVFV